MGTGASSYTPPPSPLRTLSDAGSRLSSGLIFESRLTRTDNLVAPIIIKNCMEEFQHVMEFKGPFVHGSLTDKLPRHLLVQGKYFLVKDQRRCLNKDGAETLTINNAKDGVPVSSCCQPTARELASIIQNLVTEGHSEVLLFNMREEPVLFVAKGDDFIPYTIKTKTDIGTCVVTGKLVKEADLFEANIRNEVIALATMDDENRFYFYQSVDNLHGEPRACHIEFEDHLLVSEEVYSRLAFSNTKLRFRRLCFPLHGAPSDLEVDHFISIAQDSSTNNAQKAMVFTCHNGGDRSSMGMVMGYLMLTFWKTDKKKLIRADSQSQDNNRKGTNRVDGYRTIDLLVSRLKDGPTLKNQVDSAIEKCATSECNLKSDIRKSKTRLATMLSDFHTKEEAIQQQYKRCAECLSQYFFLICFNAYLNDEYDNRFRHSFTKWMQRHPEINILRSTMCLPVYNTNYSLLESGQHCLVADNYVGLDLLGSQIDLRVANFRQINLKTIPVYGMAQPNNDGLSKVVYYLLGSKVRHTNIILVNLRNDLMVECDDATYSIRDGSKKDEPIIFPGLTKTELEDREGDLRKLIRKHKTFQVYNDLSDPPVERDIQKVYTLLELADNQRLQTLDISYYRIPLLSDESPMEKDIDNLVEVIMTHCKQEHLTENVDPAFVFFCRTGKSRSTFAMALAGLILCHLRGFPHGSRPGQQERISIPNAQFTKGEFIIVQKLVRMLPNGHQVKREIDFILDEIFNTMTPMMFHMREIIFVTYNKTKKCQTEAERMAIMGQSILYLERYIYLILFNAYLHHDKDDAWRRPFSQWMREVCARAGVYDLLDTLGFYAFEPTLSPLRYMSNRWRLHVPTIPCYGEFL